MRMKISRMQVSVRVRLREVAVAGEGGELMIGVRRKGLLGRGNARVVMALERLIGGRRRAIGDGSKRSSTIESSGGPVRGSRHPRLGRDVSRRRAEAAERAGRGESAVRLEGCRIGSGDQADRRERRANAKTPTAAKPERRIDEGSGTTEPKERLSMSTNPSTVGVTTTWVIGPKP